MLLQGWRLGLRAGPGGLCQGGFPEEVPYAGVRGTEEQKKAVGELPLSLA